MAPSALDPALHAGTPRPAAHGGGHPDARGPDGNCQSAVGSRSHPTEIGQARHRSVSGAISTCARRSVITGWSESADNSRCPTSIESTGLCVAAQKARGPSDTPRRSSPARRRRATRSLRSGAQGCASGRRDHRVWQRADRRHVTRAEFAPVAEPGRQGQRSRRVRV
jgi:hypothetical protein